MAQIRPEQKLTTTKYRQQSKEARPVVFKEQHVLRDRSGGEGERSPGWSHAHWGNESTKDALGIGHFKLSIYRGERSRRLEICPPTNWNKCTATPYAEYQALKSHDLIKRVASKNCDFKEDTLVYICQLYYIIQYAEKYGQQGDAMFVLFESTAASLVQLQLVQFTFSKTPCTSRLLHGVLPLKAIFGLLFVHVYNNNDNR